MSRCPHCHGTLTPDTIRQLFRSVSQERGKGRPVAKVDWSLVGQLRRDGMSLRQIAKLVKVSVSTLSRHLAFENIDI